MLANKKIVLVRIVFMDVVFVLLLGCAEIGVKRV
jgi:hypothetical protein